MRVSEFGRNNGGSNEYQNKEEKYEPFHDDLMLHLRMHTVKNKLLWLSFLNMKYILAVTMTGSSSQPMLANFVIDFLIPSGS